MISAEEVYKWLKDCPNKFYSDIRFEDGACKVHLKDNTELFAKSLDLILDVADRNDILIYSHKWESIDECDHSNCIAWVYTFESSYKSDYKHPKKIRQRSVRGINQAADQPT